MQALPPSDLQISAGDLALLMRSDETTVVALARGRTDRARARLALFCHARTHLRDVGLVIARECSRVGLTMEGGQAGAFLFERAFTDLLKSDQAPGRSARVTLSTTRAA